MLRIGQVEATATQDGKYTDGSVAGGIAATRLRAAAFNAMQEELAHIVESAGLALDINDMTQVLKAIQKLTLSRANPFADIKSDGAAAISTALTNLGLGEGAPAIGVPFFWPSAAMPNTVIDSWSSMVFLKFNGAKFSATDYPVLAKVFPALVLPEARGDFIRIWDDGRGVDGGRTLLSAQDFAQQRITGNFMGGAMGSSGSIKAGAFVNSYTNYGAGSQDLQYFSIDSAIETKTASETRPRNIAFNFLVRAK
ncbi:TPA: integrase [Enterobacter roggenkampii]